MQLGGGASAGAASAVSVRNEGFRSQWPKRGSGGASAGAASVCSCVMKASAAKGCPKPTREQGSGGSGGASASAASAVATRNKGFRSLETGGFVSSLQLFLAAPLAF